MPPGLTDVAGIERAVDREDQRSIGGRPRLKDARAHHFGHRFTRFPTLGQESNCMKQLAKDSTGRKTVKRRDTLPPCAAAHDKRNAEPERRSVASACDAVGYFLSRRRMSSAAPNPAKPVAGSAKVNGSVGSSIYTGNGTD